MSENAPTKKIAKPDRSVIIVKMIFNQGRNGFMYNTTNVATSNGIRTPNRKKYRLKTEFGYNMWLKALNAIKNPKVTHIPVFMLDIEESRKNSWNSFSSIFFLILSILI
jgi:hypothetical protein